MDPAVVGLGILGRLVVLVIGLEHARAFEHDLAVVLDPQFHLRRWYADTVGANVSVGLDGDEDRRFRRPVELFQIEAHGPIEIEDIRADGLTGGVAQAHARKPKNVLQGAIDQQFAKPVFEPVHAGDRLAVQHVFPTRLARSMKLWNMACSNRRSPRSGSSPVVRIFSKMRGGAKK